MTLMYDDRRKPSRSQGSVAVPRTLFLWLILLAGVLPSATAFGQEEKTSQPSPGERLEIAENEFRYQDYAKAEELLRPLLYPTVLLRQETDRIKAREYLGACTWWLKKKKEARREFTALLLEQPTHRLDPFYYPAPLVAFVETLRQELKTKGLIGSGEDPQKKPPRKIKIQAADPPWMTNFIPFGVPQLIYNKKKTGWTIFAGQLLSLGTNLVAAIWIEQLRGPNGFFSTENHPTAQNLNTIWWVSTAVFGGLYVYGVVDGFSSTPDSSTTLKDQP